MVDHHHRHQPRHPDAHRRHRHHPDLRPSPVPAQHPRQAHHFLRNPLGLHRGLHRRLPSIPLALPPQHARRYRHLLRRRFRPPLFLPGHTSPPASPNRQHRLIIPTLFLNFVLRGRTFFFPVIFSLHYFFTVRLL